MQQFIKQSTGLAEVGRACLPTYESIDDVCAAIEAGELTEGDAFATVAAHGITEDIMATINCLVSITPGNAGPENMLVTQDQLDKAGGDIECVCEHLNEIAQDVLQKVYCNDFNQLGARVGVNENNIADLQINKVSCSDYSTYISTNDTNISNLTSCTSDLKTNKVNCTDYNDTIACKVDCSDYNDFVTCTNTCLTDHENRITKLECPANYSISGNTISSDVDTNVANTAEKASQAVMNWVSGKGYTTCNGTVRCIYNSSANATCQPDANGQINMAMPVFNLSGTTLYITV